jgi:transcriptional regulator with XRE-family HTH domain
VADLASAIWFYHTKQSLTQAISIGPLLRSFRQRRGLTIEQLAQATGLTKGFLSQVERDLASASVDSLLKICGALDIRVGDLFDAEEERPALVPGGERPALAFGGIGAEDHLLTPRSNRHLQVLHSTLAAGGHSGDEEGYKTATDAQFVYVIKGEFEITLDEETFRLGAGDSLTFTGREPRRWRNPSRTKAVELLWAMTPSLF